MSPSLARNWPILFLGSSLISAKPAPLATYEFGFSLAMEGQHNTATLFVYKAQQGRVVESRPIREGAFVRQAMGVEASPANMEAINLFSRWGIRGCGASTDPSTMQSTFDCLPLHDLWKLRYGGATSGTAGSGWSQELFMPSIRQQIILQAYRHPEERHWLGPYVGAEAFRLLRDIQDPAWVSAYRDGR